MGAQLCLSIACRVGGLPSGRLNVALLPPAFVAQIAALAVHDNTVKNAIQVRLDTGVSPSASAAPTLK